jgi:hypothetical protein
MRSRAVIAITMLAVALLWSPPTHATGDVPNPSVTLIPAGSGVNGRAYSAYPYDIASRGYTEEEFTISGAVSNGAPYVSRIIVRRPIDARDSNGTAIFDWHNVTAGRELDMDFAWAHDYVLRTGYIYVGVSAQLVGVTHLRTYDPTRYGHLSHPGDNPGSFDIFEQAIQAVRHPEGVDPIRGLEVRRVIAVGQSQSAGRLATYVNDDARIGHDLVGAVLLHSGGGAIGGAAGQAANPPIPVVKLMADDEGYASRQPDSGTFRLWEEASTAHADLDSMRYFIANRSIDHLTPVIDACHAAGISMNELHRKFVLHAALDHLNRWITNGTPPPVMPRVHTDEAGQVVRDEHGNALGGIRLPDLAAPIATHDNSGCGLNGKTAPFSDATIAALYPTHEQYVAAFSAAARRGVNAGYLLRADRDQLVKEARSRVWMGARQ